MDFLKRLYPIGIQTFEKIRNGNYLYIDKTEYVYRMAHSDSNYIFLSRPRRFGKSLLLTTMKSYFEGKKENCLRVWLWRGWKRNGQNIPSCILT